MGADRVPLPRAKATLRNSWMEVFLALLVAFFALCFIAGLYLYRLAIFLVPLVITCWFIKWYFGL